MSEILDLASFRQRRGRALLGQQLRASLDQLRALPPVPNAGKSKGDFVKLSSGDVGWISEQRWLASGRLLLCVRVKGRAVWVMSDDVEPRSGA